MEDLTVSKNMIHLYIHLLVYNTSLQLQINSIAFLTSM